MPPFPELKGGPGNSDFLLVDVRTKLIRVPSLYQIKQHISEEKDRNRVRLNLNWLQEILILTGSKKYGFYS